MLDKDNVIQVKEAFKWIMQGMVTKELGGIAVVTKVSPFEVSVEFTHPETDADCHFLWVLNSSRSHEISETALGEEHEVGGERKYFWIANIKNDQ